MINVFAWDIVDGYQFLSFPTTKAAIALCGKFGQPKYTPCAERFAASIEDAKKDKESGCVTTVLLVIEGQASRPYETYEEWGYWESG